MSEPVEISVTEIDSFFRCAYRWYRRKVTGDWTDQNTRPQIRGSAVHKAREIAIQQYREKRTWPTIEELRRAGEGEIQFRMGGDGAAWSEEDEDFFIVDPQTQEKATLRSIAEEIDPYLQFDLEVVLPRFARVDIVAAEERFYVPIEGAGLQGEYVLTGKIDLLVRETVSGRLALHDLKTGSKIQQDVADLSPQLSGYSAGVHAQYGEWPLHALGSPRFLKTKPRSVGPGGVVERIQTGQGELWAVYETVTTDRNPDDVRAFLERLRVALQMREAGWFPPAPGGFMSPCLQCPHARAAGDRRCPYTSFAGGKR